MIGGFVVAGVGVHVLAAVLFDELAKRVADYVLVGLSDSIFPGLLQFLQLRLIAANAFIALRKVSRIGHLDLLQRRLFSGIVGRANFVRALERHVLKHVGETG